jgi:hypothetical protein
MVTLLQSNPHLRNLEMVRHTIRRNARESSIFEGLRISEALLHAPRPRSKARAKKVSSAR